MRGFIYCRFAAAVTSILICFGGGCNSPEVLSNRAIDFNETAAQAANSQLLLNIVRGFLPQSDPLHGDIADAGGAGERATSSFPGYFRLVRRP